MATVYTLAELSTMIDNLVSKQNGQATQLKEVVSNLQAQLVTLIKEVRTLSAGNGSPTPAELEAEIAVLRKKVDSQNTQIKEVTTSVQSQIIKIAKETVPATISIGTVETGSPGSSAAVTNAGTSSAVILDFTVPTGPVGPTGPGVTLETVAALAVSL